MKKIKFMLLSFCVLAIVAGALAFKAKGGLDFCYAATVAGPDYCGTEATPKACPTRTTNGKSITPTTFICTAPTSNISGSPCTNVTCNLASVELSTTE